MNSDFRNLLLQIPKTREPGMFLGMVDSESSQVRPAEREEDPELSR